MSFANYLYLDINRIHIAHEFILDRVHKCEYPYGRAQYGLVYVLNGKADYEFSSGNHITVTSGDVLFLSPFAAYTIVTENEFIHYTVNFDIHEYSSKHESLTEPYYMFHDNNTEQLKRSFHRLISIWTTKKAGYEMQAVGCLYELISLLYFDYNDENNTVHNKLLPAKEYIERCFNQSVSLEELAKLSKMSVTNFRREWKKQFSESPLQYRDEIRLYYAKEYLSIGYYTVSETAEKCGFDDVSYFVRFFKKKTGITPNTFKKQCMKL